MPGLEHVVKEVLGVGDRAAGDLLLESPDVLGGGLDVVLLMSGQRRDDRVGQLERRARLQSPGLDPPLHRASFAQCYLRVDGRVDRSVHGDQVVRPDELIELDVVHVAAGAAFRGVQDDERVIGVGVHFGHAVALDAVPDCHRMEAEHVRQDVDGFTVAGGDVDPHQGVAFGQ